MNGGGGGGRGVTYISKVYSANTLHNGFQCTPNNRAYVTFPMVVMSTVHHDPGFSFMSARQHVTHAINWLSLLLALIHTLQPVLVGTVS